MIRTTLGTGLIACLAACGSGGSNDATDTGLSPEEIRVTQEFAAALEEADRVSMLPVTDVMDLPLGSINFEGQLIGDTSNLIDINRVPAKALADIALTVGFDDGSVTGSVSNFAIRFEDGSFTEAEGTSVPVTSGSITAGVLDVTAQGQIVTDGLAGQPSTINGVLVELDGTVRNDAGGPAIFGDATLDIEGDFGVVIPERNDGTFHLSEVPTPP